MYIPSLRGYPAVINVMKAASPFSLAAAKEASRRPLWPLLISLTEVIFIDFVYVLYRFGEFSNFFDVVDVIDLLQDDDDGVVEVIEPKFPLKIESNKGGVVRRRHCRMIFIKIAHLQTSCSHLFYRT